MRRKWIVSTTVVAAMFLGGAAVAADKPIAPDSIKKMEAALPDKAPAAPAKPRKIIIFTMTKGFRHSSIPLAAKTIEMLGKKTGAWEAIDTDDVNMLAPEKLAEFDAVVLDQCTGKPAFADKALQASLLAFVKSGKGLVGIHAATDAFYDTWPEFGVMMGGFFKGHPFQHISVKIDDPGSPLTAMFGKKGFEIKDEIYTFKEPYSRDKLHVLLSVDWPNSGYSKGNRDDNDYALSWIHEYGQGRVFYCAFGHQDHVYWEKPILEHLLAGIQYALGDLKADATPSAKLKIEPAGGPKLAPQAEKRAKPAKAAKKADAPKAPAPAANQ